MMKNWAGKRYWLVGASEGLGASLAKEMSAQGAELILSARNEEKLAAVAKGLANKATVLPCDVGSQESVDKAVSALGKIDGIVFLAAAYWPVSAQNWDNDKCAEMANVNFLGACRVLGPVVAQFTKANSGHIVITGTIAGVRGLPSSIGYTASKAGLMTLAECMKIDLQHTNIKLQLINPGFIETKASARNSFKLTDAMTPEFAAREMLKFMSKKGFSYNYPKTIFTLFIRALQFMPSAIHYKVWSSFVKPR